MQNEEIKRKKVQKIFAAKKSAFTFAADLIKKTNLSYEKGII